MKLPSLFLLGGCLLVTTSDAFTTTTSSTRRQSNDNFELRAVNVKRRDVFASTAAGILATGGALVGMPAAALAAADYVPQLKDMQQIYFLGASLDRLAEKVKDPAQLEAALSGVKTFNKQPNFYTGYAKNFLMKSMKTGSDSDPRLGYIRQASTLIGSLEGVLSGGDALMNEKTTSEEALKRIQKAQGLISKFIAESGVQDEKLSQYLSTHKY